MARNLNIAMKLVKKIISTLFYRFSSHLWILLNKKEYNFCSVMKQDRTF